MNDMRTRDVVTATPTDTEQPTMYRHAVYILGTIGGLCVVGIVTLSLLSRPIDAGLAALGGMAVGALAALLAPRK